MGHLSDCALHNAPALPAGPCDCGHAPREAAPLMRSALEACRAWHEAERNSIGSFNDRMELCSFSEWLTRKAIAVADGQPFDEEYEGVPHLIVWPECSLRRATEAEAAALVEDTLASQGSR